MHNAQTKDIQHKSKAKPGQFTALQAFNALKEIPS